MTPLAQTQFAKRLVSWVALAAVFVSGATVRAQWSSQQITLSAGWNAIYLDVDPPARDCDTLFAAYPQIESVWKYDRRFTTVQFTQDPKTPLPDAAHWAGWLPKSSPEAFLRKLLELQGGNAYLVKVSDRAATFSLNLVGIPTAPVDQWVPNSLNFAGFPVAPDHIPTVASYFQGISQVNVGSGQSSQIYSVNPDASESQIRQPERTNLKPGAAYWLKVDRFLHSTLPFAVEGDYVAAKKIDFGSDGAQRTLTLRNLLTTTPLTLRFQILPSLTPPAGMPELAGSTPMARFISDPLQKLVTWQTISTSFEVTLAPGESRDLQLALQRTLLRPYHATGTNGATYQSLLELRETTHGIRLLLPVVASSGSGVVASSKKGSNAGLAQDNGNLPLYSLSQGLWVGQAKISQVNQPSYNTDPTLGKSGAVLQNTASALNTRLIVHVDTNGASRLLQRAILVWDPGATNTAATNGQYVLYSDEFNVPSSTQNVYRVSAATLPIMPPQSMTGVFGESISGRVFLGYDDPINPFKHQYHPDHDNYDEAYSTNKLPSGVESFDVTRQISLNFSITHQLDDGSYVPPGEVLKLDGQQSYVAIDPFQIANSTTIETWVKLDSASTTNQYLFNFGGGAKTNLYLVIGGGLTNMTFGCTSPATPTSSSITATNPFPLGQWVYIAAVIDGVSLKGQTEARLYWNGQLQASGIVNFPAGVTRNTNYFGRGPDSSAGFFKGSMYDFTIWGVVRDDDEILADMHLGYAPSTVNPIASFPADDEALVVTDASGPALKDAISTGLLKAHLKQTQWDQNSGYRTAFWDIGEREGVYTETITGLRPQPILLQGTFSLQRLNKDGTIH